MRFCCSERKGGNVQVIYSVSQRRQLKSYQLDMTAHSSPSDRKLVETETWTSKSGTSSLFPFLQQTTLCFKESYQKRRESTRLSRPSGQRLLRNCCSRGEALFKKVCPISWRRTLIWVNLSQFLIEKATIMLVYGPACVSHHCLGPHTDVPAVEVLAHKVRL
jgi:hypothetical protein